MTAHHVVKSGTSPLCWPPGRGQLWAPLELPKARARHVKAAREWGLDQRSTAWTLRSARGSEQGRCQSPAETVKSEPLRPGRQRDKSAPCRWDTLGNRNHHRGPSPRSVLSLSFCVPWVQQPGHGCLHPDTPCHLSPLTLPAEGTGSGMIWGFPLGFLHNAPGFQTDPGSPEQPTSKPSPFLPDRSVMLQVSALLQGLCRPQAPAPWHPERHPTPPGQQKQFWGRQDDPKTCLAGKGNPVRQVRTTEEHLAEVLGMRYYRGREWCPPRAAHSQNASGLDGVSQNSHAETLTLHMTKCGPTGGGTFMGVVKF